MPRPRKKPFESDLNETSHKILFDVNLTKVPCRPALPHRGAAGPLQNYNCTAALRAPGPLAIDLKDGATTGAHFRSYVADTLAPLLEPGDVVIMDNLSVRKVTGLREALEKVGARLLYLPSCSPDFNPIEQLLAKLKALLRTAAARTIPALWQTSGKPSNASDRKNVGTTSPRQATTLMTRHDRDRL